MSARVYRIHTNGRAWLVELVRDEDLDTDRSEPPVTDLPDDFRAALRRWLRA